MKKALRPPAPFAGQSTATNPLRKSAPAGTKSFALTNSAVVFNDDERQIIENAEKTDHPNRPNRRAEAEAVDDRPPQKKRQKEAQAEADDDELLSCRQPELEIVDGWEAEQPGVEASALDDVAAPVLQQEQLRSMIRGMNLQRSKTDEARTRAVSKFRLGGNEPPNRGRQRLLKIIEGYSPMRSHTSVVKAAEVPASIRNSPAAAGMREFAKQRNLLFDSVLGAA